MQHQNVDLDPKRFPTLRLHLDPRLRYFHLVMVVSDLSEIRATAGSRTFRKTKEANDGHY
jgi:hypothetical protein